MFNFFRNTDQQMEADILQELKWDPKVIAGGITVSVHEGIVTLRGTVGRDLDKTAAENAAQRVCGVRAVADEIHVSLTGEQERSDEDIARSALTALDGFYHVPKNVRLSVIGGWVTLRGELEWDFQNTEVTDAIKCLTGVRGVKNEVTVKAGPLPSDIKSRIEAALKRSFHGGERAINVKVIYNRVTLSGWVHSVEEIKAAGTAVWSCRGVVGVENNLMLGI